MSPQDDIPDNFIERFNRDYQKLHETNLAILNASLTKDPPYSSEVIQDIRDEIAYKKLILEDPLVCPTDEAFKIERRAREA